MSDRLTGDFRKFMDKSFLGSWDVPDGQDLVLTIDYASRDDVQNEKGREKKLALHFRERDYKPMICNTTNAKAISKAYGSTRVEDWEGKRIAIYKATISAFGQTQECLRVRDIPPRVTVCEDCGEQIEDAEIGGKWYRAKAIAERSRSRFGRVLCADCARLEKERLESDPDSYDEDLNRQVANELEELRDGD